ncbi:XRE family transcriptional regulator [Kitasatospora sp. NPDC059088]|uniref:XRE family transcriptional regulator n=1 Tax=Kitasatospora sp. NPDC059088 TaxID=3346722 RepID=UPI0036C62110
MQQEHPLVRARRVRNLERPDLARQVRTLSGELGTQRWTGPDGVLRWEEGRTPDPETQRVLARLFGIDPALVDRRPWPAWLDADPLQEPPVFPWTAGGALCALTETIGKEDDMHRRTFITSSAAVTAALLQWLTADPAAAEQILAGRRVGESGVAAIERRVRELRRTDDEDGGGTLVTDAGVALRMVVELLSNRSHTLAHGQRLYAAAADLSRIRAWAGFDVHGRCDDYTFTTALRCAHAAGDRDLGAHILTFWAAAAYNCDRRVDAEAMASTAMASVHGKAAPRVQALVRSRRARARSHLGDDNCWEDLDLAEALLAEAAQQGADEDEPPWAYWFDLHELQGARASTQLTMGRPAEAEATFAASALAFEGDAQRTRSVYLVRQADAQRQQGHLEQACATANQALDITDEISSHRTTEPLRDLARDMRLHSAVPAVHALRERIADLRG